MLIPLLIQICILVAVVYLVIWVITQLLPVPDFIVKIIWIIVLLVVVSWVLPALGVHVRGIS